MRYRTRRGNDQRLRGLLRELAQKRRRFGYRRLAVMLRRLGERVNVKRVYRLYREEQLHLRRKRHRKRIAGPRGALLPCSRPNQRWSLDFMTDSLGNGRKLRIKLRRKSACSQFRKVSTFEFLSPIQFEGRN